MNVDNFDYAIDAEVKDQPVVFRPVKKSWESDDGWDDLELELKTKENISKPKKRKMYSESVIYDREPKPETYYIVYKGTEFSILANKLGFLDEFRRIVLAHNGDFYGGEDEFYEEEDAEKVVAVLKDTFKNDEWFIQTLSASIEKMFSKSTCFDDRTFQEIKERFFMLEEETLYRALIFLANQ